MGFNSGFKGLILTTTECEHNVCSPEGPEALGTEVSQHN